jgi:hypothetical protein
MVRSLDMHGHWINSIALSSDHVMRNSPPNEAEAKLSPAQRYAKATGGVEERMVLQRRSHAVSVVAVQQQEARCAHDRPHATGEPRGLQPGRIHDCQRVFRQEREDMGRSHR